MDLFVVYVGFGNKGANLELHDMRFAVGKTIEDCHCNLIDQWWDKENMFHLDAWGALKSADNYNIKISDTPANHQEKLFFINLGGYDPEQFTELHKNVFIVAKDSAEAKKKAKLQIQEWTLPHKDNLFEVEKILELNKFGEHYIHLEPTESPQKFKFICDYKVIKQPADHNHSH